jgi:hypothetical protein
VGSQPQASHPFVRSHLRYGVKVNSDCMPARKWPGARVARFVWMFATIAIGRRSNPSSRNAPRTRRPCTRMNERRTTICPKVDAPMPVRASRRANARGPGMTIGMVCRKCTAIPWKAFGPISELGAAYSRRQQRISLTVRRRLSSRRYRQGDHAGFAESHDDSWHLWRYMSQNFIAPARHVRP